VAAYGENFMATDIEYVELVDYLAIAIEVPGSASRQSRGRGDLP
jgi:hypothetical protein